MQAPKCKLCGERHYGLCAVPAKQPFRKPFDTPLVSTDFVLPGPLPPNPEADTGPGYGIYAVSCYDKEGCVKLGYTANWKARLKAYPHIRESSLFYISEVPNPKVIETACLVAMGLPPCQGMEWFSAALAHAEEAIARVLGGAGIAYTIRRMQREQRSVTPMSEDRKAYHREYMRKRRAGEIVPHSRPKVTPEQRAAYMREYMRKRRIAQLNDKG
jgi:hypothetical protein